MKVLFDTNMVLDVMLDREPFSTTAAQLFSMVETGALAGFIGATTVTTIHYLASKVVGSRQALQEIRKLFELFEIAPINRTVLEGALALKFKDFEDAVLHEAARHAGAQAIVTRDSLGFNKASMTIYTSEELVKIFIAGNSVH